MDHLNFEGVWCGTANFSLNLSCSGKSFPQEVCINLSFSSPCNMLFSAYWTCVNFVFVTGRVHDFIFGTSMLAGYIYIFFSWPLPLPSKVKWSRPKKGTFFSRKPLETESFAKGQFVIDSCCLVSQSKYLNNSTRIVILAFFLRVQMHPCITFTPLENKVWLRILVECEERKLINSIAKQVKKIQLCSVLL